MSEPGILPSPIPFGKYYLLERVNVGGMAEVYKAKAFGEEGFERILAVKKILASIAEDEAFINMFIDEAKITGRLNHPNICQVFDLGIADGSHFIAMEYIGGKDLKTIFERSRRLGERVSIPKICFEIMKINEGLSHAHEKKDVKGNPLEIVHRDISPQNVLISYEGEVKIIDFGIAKASGKTSQTQVGILKGKFSYMSPEQVRGLHVDNRSDIFSLGILMYELLTLERLFLGESDFDTLEKIRKVEMSPPSLYNPHIPQELEKICLKALAKSPEERFQSCAEFAEALETFMRSQGFYYSNKDLATYMKEAFSADIEFEAKKLDYYRSLNLKPIESGIEVTPPAPKRPSRGLSWGEEEMETQIFDREDEIMEADIVSSSARPTVEFDRWNDDGMPFADDPPRRAIHATEQVSAVNSKTHRVPANVTMTHRPKKSRVRVFTAIAVVLIGLAAIILWTMFRANKVLITTEPTSVEIWVNGGKVYDGETPYELSLPTGPAHLELKREGFETFVKQINVERGRGYTLKQNLNALDQTPANDNAAITKMMVKTDPPGATIEINGKSFPNPTPFTFENLGKGPFLVKISKEGYLPVERNLKTLDAAGLDLRLKPANFSMVIRSKPSRSKFLVYEKNGKSVLHRGTTPQTIKMLDSSKKYRVVVKRSDFESWEDVIEPGFEKESSVEATLSKKSDRDSKRDNVRDEKERKRAEIAAQRLKDKWEATERARKEKEKRDKEKRDKEKRDKEKTNKDEKPGVGYLYVQSNPVARVYIDGRDTGRYTPLLKFKISSGKKHRIKLVNAEYGLSKTYYVNVKAGAKKKLVNKK